MSSRSCLEEPQLQALLDESCSHNDLTTYTLHLESCRHCQVKLEELAGGLSVPVAADIESTRIKGDSALGILITNLKSDPQQDATKTSAGEPVEHWRDALDPPRFPESLGRIGDYDLTEVLGSGGMGVVLRGRDSILDRDVALKFPHRRLTRTEKSRERFLNEARSAAALEHENVVRVYQVGVQHDEPYLVMELVEGETLQDRLNRQTPLASEELRKIAVQAARALEAAHQQGMLHGDVKPANLLINRQTGQLKLSDFGLAGAVCDSQNENRGAIAGTPEYMSPEQAGGRPVDARSDLYSLGAVLYALATGTMPVCGEDLDDLLRRIETDSIEPVRQRNPKLDSDLARMIDRLLSKQPADRPSSGAEVEAKLSLDRMRVRRRILVAALATISLVACFVVAEFAGWIDAVDEIGPQEIVSAPLPFLNVNRDISFETLEEAIAKARDGDVVEIRSPGPHAVRPIQIRDKSLTIRGAEGKPAIVPFQSSGKGEPLIFTNAALQLESLEINFQAPAIKDLSRKWQNCAVLSQQATIRISKCRFRISKGNAAIAVDSGGCWVDDCEVFSGGDGIGVVWRPSEHSKLVVQNCLLSTRIGIFINGEDGLNFDDSKIEIAKSTFRVDSLIHIALGLPGGHIPKNWPMTANENVFEASQFFSLGPLRRIPIEKRVQRGRWLLRNLLSFSGENNRIREGASLAVIARNPPVPLFTGEESFESWKRFLGGKKDAIEFGTIKFYGPADSPQRKDHQVESFDPTPVSLND